MAHKVDLAGTLPSDGSPICGDFIEFEVPLRGKARNKVGKGKVVLKATKPMDKDVFRFECEPPSASVSCPTTTTSTSTTTTSTTSTSTTSTAPGPCTGGESGPFCDLGDGTIFDRATGMQWEKKDGADGTPGLGTPDPGNLHDVDNRYSWAGRCTMDGGSCQPNAAAEATCFAQARPGTTGCSQCACRRVSTCDVDPFGNGVISTVWDWVNQLNAESFAGHAGWRLASVPRSDPCCEVWGCPTGWLQTILDEAQGLCGGGSGACIDPIFGPTAANFYWSATPDYHVSDYGCYFDPASAVGVSFGHGTMYGQDKAYDGFVRAVRDPYAPTTTSTTSSTTTTIPAPGPCTGGESGPFCDLGDGTIFDRATGMEWEQKDGADGTPGLGTPDPGNLHDVDNWYSWAGCCEGTCDMWPAVTYCQPNAPASATCFAQAGINKAGCSLCASGTCLLRGGIITTVWDWINQVNAAMFAGHADWRVPAYSYFGGDLQAILDDGWGACGGCGDETLACIDPIFGPTTAGRYWTATSSSYSNYAYIVDFGQPLFGGGDLLKDWSGYVRAVR